MSGYGEGGGGYEDGSGAARMVLDGVLALEEFYGYQATKDGVHVSCLLALRIHDVRYRVY